MLFLMLLLPLMGSTQFRGISDNDSLQLEELLEKIVVANRYYSYEALLTYEANGTLSTLRLSHIIDYNSKHHKVQQHLAFLDGTNRHIIREQELKYCGGGKTKWGLWPSHFDVEYLNRYYRMTIQRKERIAERQALTIDFAPKDKFRYGYRFSIDTKTGLILRSLVIQNDEILERTTFVSLSFETHALRQHSDKSATSWRVPEVEPCHTEQFQSAWSVGWLPAGFAPAGNRMTALGEQMLMFTDGIVSISVFIISGSDQNLPKVTAYRGATVAVISPLSFDPSNSVAVVGEVPAVTARRMAVSVRSP